MKKVVRSTSDALRMIEQVNRQLGREWKHPMLVEIKRFKSPRSLPQNAKVHAMVRELANEIGYSEDELMDYFKETHGEKKLFSVGGVDKMIPMSTTEYTREQMSEFISQIERVGAELGFRFSHE